MVRAPLGFEPAGVLTFHLEAPEWKYRGDDEVRRFWDEVVPRVGGIAGADVVAATSRLPQVEAGSTTTVAIEGRASQRDADRPWAIPATVTPGYFAALRIPVRTGRAFSDRDSPDAPRVAIVNEEMARRYWGAPAGAVGARVAIADTAAPPVWLEVVGVVGDVLRENLEGADPELFIPAAQQPRRAMTVLVRSASPAALAGAVRGEIRGLDSEVAVFRMRTYEKAFEEEQTTTAVLIGMFVAFAGLALALAATGLYGVMAFAVAQRTQEIGIRIALGAAPRDISRMVARQSAVLVLGGCALGVAGGVGIAQLTRTLLYGVSPFDPATFAGVIGLLIFVAAAACAVPVRRAMRVDTVQVLRAG
jgi:predicted permease